MGWYEHVSRTVHWFQLCFHHQCQQLIGFHNRWQRLWDHNADNTQWCRGLCHEITFRVSELMLFAEHESPLKGFFFGSPLLVSVEAITSVHPSGTTWQDLLRLKNKKTASENKALPELNNLSHTRHKLMPFLDQWVTLAAFSTAPPSGQDHATFYLWRLRQIAQMQQV